jgi:ubiquinone/menaquinone biosynthesis C-methylase UbiE
MTVQAEAESIPFKSSSFDGVICKVVLPYTDERKVLEEVGRVLRPGGKLILTVHGIGYYVHYLVFAESLLRRVYSLLTIVNTFVYRITGIRWRSTIYQSRNRLNRYFKRYSFFVIDKVDSRTFCRLPVFMYLVLRKIENSVEGIT